MGASTPCRPLRQDRQVCCGLGCCACAQGAREDLHADGAESKQRRAHRQVQLPAAPSNGENRI